MKTDRVWLYLGVLEKNRRVFKIPVYQRNYDWNNVQCEKLFHDIMVAHDRDHKHFTGTIVYIIADDGTNLTETLVIDGQQRIVTLYILLQALHNAAKGKNTEIEKDIEGVMFNKNCAECYKVKLKPIKSDDEQLNLLLHDKIEKMDRNSNIYKNYVLFQELIANVIAKGYGMEDILDGIKHLEAVEIVLKDCDGDEPQKIFESINSTGLDLSLADLVRNYLLMDDKNQDELYETYWIEIEKNVGYQNLGDFVINFLNSRISKAINLKNAYQLFKDYCEYNELNHQQVLQELARTSRYYGAFIGENDYYSDEIKKYLKSFRAIKQTTVLPLLFRLLGDYEEEHINDKALCKVLRYLLTYYVRITACEINKNLSKFMKSIYDRVIDGSNYDNYYEKFATFLNGLRANDRMPSDKEFEDALIYKPLYKKPICRFVLSAIENSGKEHIDISNLTIEHILPQKENAAVWKKEIGKDYSHVYEVYLHTLGNLTITGYNSELGAKTFTEKKKIIKSTSKAVTLNRDVLSENVWNESAILKRARNLASILVEQFKYENVQIQLNENTDVGFTLSTNIDLTNTKPKSFTFVGEYTRVNNWSDVLTGFMNVSYELDNELISALANDNYSIPNASNVYISNDKRNFRKPKEIETTGIYYESNLAANTIISFIRNMVQEMDLEQDDFSYTLSEIPFDINNEATWEEGIIPIAQLFFNLTKDLIEKNRLTESEVIKLKTKEYTKTLFQASDYPAIANKRTDNMGNSLHKRYRAKPLQFNGKEIFVSTQFFDSDRIAVIEWYKKHLI